MRKRVIAILLSAVMLLGMIPMSASAAAGDASGNPAEHWFYDQLSDQGKDIYDAILKMYTAGAMTDGKESFDLVAEGVVGQSVVQNYLDGNRTLFNDFAAAKDAFDLEHPDAWYVDSSELSFRVTSGANGTLHAYMGPGKSEDYYVKGVADSADVAAKTAALDKAVGDIVSGAKGTDYEKVKYVHSRITRSISYRFETDCKLENKGYIRTAYALVTHQGVCEGYARSFQYVLNELGIPCVLVHGLQTSGTPEDHMWTAVQLTDPNTKKTNWYVVDATWDDPVAVDSNGNVKETGSNGNDGYEVETYLLVGQNVLANNWQPSGYVSTGTMEFHYPEIAEYSYGSGAVADNGLKVEYDTSLMEGTKSTVYRISFNGDGLKQSADKGYYFLTKMYKLRADGSVDAINNWYYPAHMLHAMNADNVFDPDDDFQNTGNEYYHDTDKYLVMDVSNCDYVEFAVTTIAPPDWQSAEDLLKPEMDGYYKGDYSNLVAESGMLFNVNGSYEPPPYIKNASPGFNTSISADKTHRIHIEFSDNLYHPTEESLKNTPENKINEAKDAMAEEVTMDYKGTTYDWGMNGRQPHVFSKKPSPENLVLFCETHETHDDVSAVGADCEISGLEYDFTPSDMWADDSVQHEFYFTGLVGRKSNKRPNHWSYVFEHKYPFWTCPLYSGYRWNLWGQPQALDNPNNLDLGALSVQGVDGSVESLMELYGRTNADPNDMNGRLMLVVENVDGSRDRNEELANAISESGDVEVPADAVLSSSLFEIDFARVCRCTVVETGQTLRLCVGFPPGIDASMAGLVFKAYHFTRDIDKSCSEVAKAKEDPTYKKDPTHAHTGEIYSVEEIPCTVTEQGLVITCKSFSPFEIVALDSSKVGDLEPDTDRYVVLSSDGNGTVEATDVTVGENESKDMVKFVENATHTFKITPKEGYVIDSVSFTGEGKITVDGKNEFSLTYDDVAGVSAVLNVAFVPESIKQAEEERGEAVETPEVCKHENKTPVEAKEATCTEAGNTAGWTCDDCGQVLGVENVPAKGHDFVDSVCTRCSVACTHESKYDIEEKAATCTEPGHTAGQICKDCSAVLSESKEIPAKGHTEGKADTEADCEHPGATGRVVCSVCGEVLKEGETTPALGHNYVDGKCTRCGKTEPGKDDPSTDKKLPVQYIDVPEEAWYYKYITDLYYRGLLTGTSPTTMKPQNRTTRAEVVSVLWRMCGAPPEGNNDFTDVPETKWYTPAINWAVKNKIVAGYEDGKFRPDRYVTREEMIAIMYRYAGYRKANTEVKPGYTMSFADGKNVDSWAVKAVTWGQINNMISGYDDGTFRPKNHLTRAEMARIMSSFCNWVENPKEEDQQEEQKPGEDEEEKPEQEKE